MPACKFACVHGSCAVVSMGWQQRLYRISKTAIGCFEVLIQCFSAALLLLLLIVEKGAKNK